MNKIDEIKNLNTIVPVKFKPVELNIQAAIQDMAIVSNNTPSNILNPMEYLSKVIDPSFTKEVPKATVAVFKGDDKFEVFEKVINETNFMLNLENKWKESGKDKADFKVVIKPNFMMALQREEPQVHTYTDPQLVEYLVDKIRNAGFTNIYLVESQNLYGNIYENRTVKNVARFVGYKPKEHGYKISDLTEERDSKNHNYGGILGNHPVGKVWKDADYRVSFAKNKTHMSESFTLCLKNIYGCTPMQNKALEYHGLREMDESTVDMLRNFPVDFGFVDGMWSCDGFPGQMGTPVPKETKIIYGGNNLVAIDMIGAKMMGIAPKDSAIMRGSLNVLGEPAIEFKGNIDKDYKHDKWRNLPMPDDAIHVFGKKLAVPELLTHSALYHSINKGAPRFFNKLVDPIDDCYATFQATMIGTGLAMDGFENNKEDFPLKSLPKLTYEVGRDTIKNIFDMVIHSKRRKALFEDIKGLF